MPDVTESEVQAIVDRIVTPLQTRIQALEKAIPHGAVSKHTNILQGHSHFPTVGASGEVLKKKAEGLGVEWGAAGGVGISFAAPSAVIDIGDSAAVGAAATALRSDAQFAFPAPAVGYPEDIAATESDRVNGAETSPAYGTHRHRGVHVVKKSGAADIYGDITLSEGANVTLTQTANDIVIASTGGGAGSMGIPGNDGEDGVDGAPGIPGAVGATGDTGVTGPAGPPGIGEDGEDGPAGPPGAAGAAGAAGVAGATGSTGPAGPPGVGLDGEDGEPGIPGIPGAAGVAGTAGVTGPAGPPGIGFDGEDGDNGIPGAAGAAGVAGAAGSQGVPGPPGTGSDGDDGLQGLPGASGAVAPAIATFSRPGWLPSANLIDASWHFLCPWPNGAIFNTLLSTMMIPSSANITGRIRAYNFVVGDPLAGAAKWTLTFTGGGNEAVMIDANNRAKEVVLAATVPNRAVAYKDILIFDVNTSVLQINDARDLLCMLKGTVI